MIGNKASLGSKVKYVEKERGVVIATGKGGLTSISLLN